MEAKPDTQNEALETFLPGLRAAITDLELALLRPDVEKAPWLLVCETPAETVVLKRAAQGQFVESLDKQPLTLDGCLLFTEESADENLNLLKSLGIAARKLHKQEFYKSRLNDLKGLLNELTKSH